MESIVVCLIQYIVYPRTIFGVNKISTYNKNANRKVVVENGRTWNCKKRCFRKKYISGHFTDKIYTYQMQSLHFNYSLSHDRFIVKRVWKSLHVHISMYYIMYIMCLTRSLYMAINTRKFSIFKKKTKKNALL